MPELFYNPLPNKDMRFLQDCPFRRPYQGSAASNLMSCGMVEEAAGMPQPINPMNCAQCVSDSGAPNPAYIRSMARNMLLGQAQLCFLGFFDDPERIKGIFKRAWEVLEGDIQNRKIIADMLENCIKKGRLTREDAMALIRDHIPGLGEVDL